MSFEKKWNWIEGGVAAPRGFIANGVQAGIKYEDKYDVAVIMSDVPSAAAGVFTQNKVKAHPVLLSQQHIKSGKTQAVVVNSGNANACVGQPGDSAALEMARKTAELLKLETTDVLVASTGVIGVELPMDKISSGIENCIAEMMDAKSKDPEKGVPDGAHKAALAIMTTDTVEKEVACEMSCQGGTIRLGAMAKGSGMIHPNMGTMLGFVTTDAVVPADQLQGLLKEAVDESFNMITVDGDTSTNDTVFLLANGASGVVPTGDDWESFKDMVKEACVRLAKAIAGDGEGASKLIEVQVTGTPSKEDARKIAKSICGSSLVKTAIFGEEANWGRIMVAMGYAGAELDPGKAEIFIGAIPVAQKGQGIEFSEEEAQKALHEREVKIKVNLYSGEEEATAWGCDLTHEYVTINGSYMT